MEKHLNSTGKITVILFSVVLIIIVGFIAWILFMRSLVPCNTCEGKGTLSAQCEICYGNGYLQTEQVCPKCSGDWNGIFGTLTDCKTCDKGKIPTQSKCINCNGTGKTSDPCPHCSGSGRIPRQKLEQKP